jgi:hypothetical protein
VSEVDDSGNAWVHFRAPDGNINEFTQDPGVSRSHRTRWRRQDSLQNVVVAAHYISRSTHGGGVGGWWPRIWRMRVGEPDLPAAALQRPRSAVRGLRFRLSLELPAAASR